MGRMAFDTEEDWLDARLGYITSSDVPAVLGISPYSTALEVWEQKVSRKREPSQPKMRRRFEAGHHFEPLVAQWFTEETGVCCYQPHGYHLQESVEFPWIAASTDLETNERGVVEVKSAGVGGADHYLESKAWPYAVSQVHTAMLATGSNHGWVAVVFGMGHDFRVYPVERSQPLVDLIVERTRNLWTCVEQRVCPPESFIQAGKEVREALARAYALEPETEIELKDEASADELARWEVLDAQRKEFDRQSRELKEQQSELENRALRRMGGRQLGVIPHAEKMWKRSEQNRKAYTVQASTFTTIKPVKR